MFHLEFEDINDTSKLSSGNHPMPMELRRAADAVLRSQASPLASFLTPSIASRWQAGKQLGYRCSANRISRRSFTNTSIIRAIKPQPTTSAFPAPSATDMLSALDSATPQEPTTTNEQPKPLSWLQGRPSRQTTSSTTPRSPFLDGGSLGRLDPEREKAFNGGTSASDLLDALNKRTIAASSPSANQSRIDVSRMLDPSSGHLSSNAMADLSTMLMPTKQEKVPMRLNPSTGRSVQVGGGVDVGRAFNLLEMSCARNSVKHDFNYQRFHERGGLKRKRLRRQRWRKRFMEGFRATVMRVKQLKNQGW